MPPSKMTFSIASAAAVCLVLLCVHKPSAQAALPTSAGLVLAVDANAGKPVAYASHARPARAGETIANQSEAADDFGVVTDTANAAGVNTTEAAAEAPCKNEPGCKYERQEGVDEAVTALTIIACVLITYYVGSTP